MKEYKIPKGLVFRGKSAFPDLERLYREALYIHRENHDYAIGRQGEKEIVEAVAKGDVDFIETVIAQAGFITLVGNLSDSEIRQLRYYAMALITIVSRAAIDGGMAEQEGFALSDALFYKLDMLNECEAIEQLTSFALMEFARRMHKIRNIKYSRNVAKCRAYISGHMYECITLEDLARVCKLSPDYISALFKKETGYSIKQYVLREKLTAAQEMLMQGGATVQQVASDLGFSSSSHFSSAFRAWFGMTPSQWRNRSASEE